MPEDKPHVSHYEVAGIQPIDYMEASFTAEEYEGYLKGNVIKYLARYRNKGQEVKDLDKAIVYLQWLRDWVVKTTPSSISGNPPVKE